ncbi:hypothetical protein DL346_02115 [Paenibacillus montanisoli]|uniref:Uncharacterized protein n=1 Tax=Paenibacillus montanisoli TaxID=2081970 RepID=A0A328UAL1_9BACL|nr:hypothetical protein DL346_02115 [Paenibacillus montanisoli]
MEIMVIYYMLLAILKPVPNDGDTFSYREVIVFVCHQDHHVYAGQLSYTFNMRHIIERIEDF